MKLPDIAKKRDVVALTFALAFFWPMFVLFMFPLELFPHESYGYSELRYSLLFMAIVALCALGFRFAKTQRRAFSLKSHAEPSLTTEPSSRNKPNPRLVASGSNATPSPRIEPSLRMAPDSHAASSRAASSPMAGRFLAALLIVVCAQVGFSLMLQVSGKPVPTWLFWLYPCTMSAYCFTLALCLARASEHLSEKEMALVLTSSLILSHIIQTSASLLMQNLGLACSQSNYLSLIVSGLIALQITHRKGSPKSEEKPRSAQRLEGAEGSPSGKAPVLAAASASASAAAAAVSEPAAKPVQAPAPTSTLAQTRRAVQVRAKEQSLLIFIVVFYLIGSGIFMGSLAMSTDGVWQLGQWEHNVIGLLIDLAFLLYAINAQSKDKDPYPWIAFVFICLVVLYCTVLLYPAHSAICAEIILPSRPLAIMLLWAAVVARMRSGEQSVALGVCCVFLPIACVVNALTNLAGFIGLENDALTTVITFSLLCTALAVTVGLAGWLAEKIRAAKEPAPLEPAENARSTNANAPESSTANTAGAPGSANALAISALSREYSLSERESEVLKLLSEGNTQKRIAQELIVSVNSVQTYAKSLYRKLGIHSRQELIDLVNARASESAR